MVMHIHDFAKTTVGGKSFRLCKSLIALCAALAFGTAVAEVYHWTGAAKDGVWANAANWQENEIPGMWTNRTEQTSGGKLGDTVIFGAQAEGAPTTIDLQGQYAIDHLIVTNGAPAYTFGTSDVDTQRLGFQTNSTLVVAADVVNDQTFVRPAVWNPDSGTTGALLAFYNNSPNAKLVYGKIDHVTAKTGHPFAIVRLYGVGTIEITGDPTFDQVGNLDFYNSELVVFHNTAYTGARYTLSSFKDLSGGTHEIEVPAGAFIGSKGGSWTWSDLLQFQGNTHIFGDGYVNITKPYNTPEQEDPTAAPRLHIWNGKRAVIDAGIGTVDANKSLDTIVFPDGDLAELFLNGTNSLPTRLRMLGTGSVFARLIGNKNCAATETSVGRGDAIVYESTWTGTTKKVDNKPYIDSITPTAAPKAKFYYAGTGETTDKDLIVSNIYNSAASVTLGNCGTGTLTWNGDAKNPSANATTFTLEPKTAPIVFGGLFEPGRTWNLAVKGASTVSFSQAQPGFSGSATLSGGVLELTSPAQLPNVTGFTFAGGALRLTESGAVTLNATFQSGASAIELGDGVALTLPSLTLPSGASLNIVAPDGGSASVTVTGATAGPLPATVTYNGDRAIIDDQGRIQPNRSSWLSAQDGTWNTAAKWSNGVPTSDMTALVTASGESYTVAIDEAPAQAISDLKIANDGPGTATVAATTELDMGKANIDLQPGGALAAGDGGTLYITNATVAFNGGSINASGSGLVNVKADFVFGPGTNTFSGTSCLQVGGSTEKGTKLHMVPTPDAPCVLTLSEQATYCHNQGYWMVCSNVPGGRAILNIDCTDGVTIRSGTGNNMYGMAVGCRQGYGELNLRHGFFEMGNMGLYVAADSPNNATSDAATPYCVTGVVNQTGGDFKISCWGWHYAGMICGLVVGDGTRVRLTNPDMLTKSVCVGFYNLSGGTVTINIGASVIGGGIGTGYFNQSGGTYYHNAKNTKDDFTGYFPLVIGLGRSGKGVWTMTGGTTDIRNHVYVGGAQKADLQHKVEPNAAYYPDGDGCTGILDVSNGTFVTTQDLYVGAKGTGTLVLRPTGTIQAANVVLSNGVASVLRPVVEGAATGLLKATGDLVITDGARLEIDATGISANAPGYIQLASAGNVVGEFSAGKVSIEYDETDPAMRSRFRTASILYELGGENGLWLKASPQGILVIVR